jgi:hypothetical protein
VASWQRNHDQDGEVEVPVDISGDFYLYFRRKEGSGGRLGYFLRHLPSGREHRLPAPPSFAQDFHVPQGTIRVPLELHLVGGLLYWAEEYRRIPGDGTYEGWSVGVADLNPLLKALEKGSAIGSDFAPRALEAAHGDGSTELLDVHLSERGLFWAEGTEFHAWYESTGKTGEGGIPPEQTLHALLPAS